MDSSQKSRQPFSGPTEKRAHYIRSLLIQLRESDQDGKTFSKGELAELQEVFRKEAITSPALYKMFQTIVDDCIWLDEDLVKQVDKEESVESVPVEHIEASQSVLEEQNEMDKLIKFNQIRIDKMQTHETVNEDCLKQSFSFYETLNKEVGQIHQKLFSSPSSLNTLESSLKQIKTEFRSFQKQNEAESIMNKLLPVIEKLAYRVIIKLEKNTTAQTTSQSQLQTTIHTLLKDKGKSLKIKFLLVDHFLFNILHHLLILQKEVLQQKQYVQLKSELDLIRTELAGQYAHLLEQTSPNYDNQQQSNNFDKLDLLNGNVPEGVQLEDDKFQLLHSKLKTFFQEKGDKLNLNIFDQCMQKLRMNLILFQNKIDNNA